MKNVERDALSDYEPAAPSLPLGEERRPRGEFIRGPIPLPWVAEAARLRGRALAVGLAIWFRKGIEKKATFQLYPSALERLGVSRWSAYRALKGLEKAGLVRAERRRGRSPVVTVLDRADLKAEGQA